MKWQNVIKARWSIALAALVILSISVVVVSEVGWHRRNVSHLAIDEATQASIKLDDLVREMLELETAQRGYLLTGKESYLASYETTKPKISALSHELTDYFRSQGDAAAIKTFDSILQSISNKFTEIETTIDLAKRGKPEAAQDTVKTDLGKLYMDKLRSEVELIQHYQHSRIAELTRNWKSVVNEARVAVVLVTLLNLALLALMVRLMLRDMDYERHKRQVLQNQQAMLDELVKQRTTQLETLATHLQNVSEAEKSRLARELHDELGSILTASKMDVMWVKKRLVGVHDDLVEKLNRALQNLDVGIHAKRRIIEDMRPTTLMSFGLTTAAQELIGKVRERTGWKLDVSLPEEDPALPETMSIALFRILQEALNNAEKYAQAKSVYIRLALTNDAAYLEVKDSGIGFRTEFMRPKSHGLSGMRQRVSALGGVFEIHSSPGAGTRIHVMLPIRREEEEAVNHQGEHQAATLDS